MVFQIGRGSSTETTRSPLGSIHDQVPTQDCDDLVQGQKGLQSQSREELETITLSAWAGVFDRTSKAHGTDLESLGANYLRGFLFEQFGEGAVDKAAGLSSDLEKV